MNKCEIAGFFDVSRPTVNDWQRRGAPIGKDGGDPAAVAEWKARRDLAKLIPEGEPAFRDLPSLMAELTRRQVDLQRRIDLVNVWPPGTDKTPNMVKAAVIRCLIVERALLDLPARIINDPNPATLPVRLIREVFNVLDDMETESDDPSSPSPEKRWAVAAESGMGRSGCSTTRKKISHVERDERSTS